VQEAADGNIVVIHDSDLKKVGGVPMVVSESTLRELKWVDVGSWFDLSFNEERVPTLREVLELCKDRIGVNIELKYYGSEKNLERSVAEIVDAAGMSNQVMAMSLSLPGARKMKSLRPDWKVGLLSSVSLGNLGKLDVDFLALNARVATRPLVRRLHARGKEVFVWTVNDAVGISAMAGRGVDAIITDEPALAVDLLQQRKELGPHERMILSLAELFDRPSLLGEQ
jgi:glycerophosphoryl diester phosphodiesterase